MIVELEEQQILVKRPSDSKTHRALHGLTRSLVANMVRGVTEGYEKVLEIRGVGYREQTGEEARPERGLFAPGGDRRARRHRDLRSAADPHRGAGHRQGESGAVAANIRAVREPEPYLGKGIKYIDEQIRRKAGKAGKVSK